MLKIGVYTPIMVLGENTDQLSSSDMDILKECSECTCFNLRKVTRVITQYYDEALKETGLRVTQFTMLVHILSGKRLNITELADLMYMDRTTLARNLDPLERKGLVEVRAGDDRRTRHVVITNKGIEALKVSLPLWQRVQNELVSVIGKKEWDSMRSDLNELLKELK